MNTENKVESVEVWETELIVMNCENRTFTDSLNDHSQYLYLYPTGKAELIDSLTNGQVRQSESSWEIRKQNGRDIFLFGYGKESQGILGVAYPIIIKNETIFKMAFDSLNEHHKWNLRRIN